MDKKKAAEILRALSQGRDPLSGVSLESLEPRSSSEVLKAPEVRQALLLAEVCCRESLQRDEQRSSRPAKVGAAWTEFEDTKLLEEFDSGLSIEILAERHQRSRSAISSRLMKLGRTDEMG